MSKVLYSVATQNRFAGLLSDNDSEKDVVVQVPKVATKMNHFQKEDSKDKRQISTSANTEKKNVSADTKIMRQKNKIQHPKSQKNEAPIVDVKTRGQKNYQRNKVNSSNYQEKKNHDRHSGTGRGKEMKKSGACGFNWGNDALDYKVARSSNNDLEAEVRLDGRKETYDKKDPANNIIDYTEYQKQQKLKRANLIDNDQSLKEVSGPRLIDSRELVNEGYEKYEREESEADKAKRETIGFEKYDESEEEPANRQRAINLNQFKNRMENQRKRRNRKPLRDDKSMKTFETTKKCDDLTCLNLQDLTVFPSLA